jgi:hypothetical protein
MTPGEYQALTELVRQTLARARDTARRSAEIQATAAELTVSAEDLCSRARAERERARELASERPRRGPRSDASVISYLPSAVAVPTAATRGMRQVDRRV